MAREIKSADARALEVEQQMTDDESFSRNAGSYCSSPRLRSQSATCIVATPGTSETLDSAPSQQAGCPGGHPA
jgi:hypothetical protein